MAASREMNALVDESTEIKQKALEKKWMKTILVTGFTPFDGEEVNPSWEAVKALPDEILGVTIEKMEIPTVYGRSADAVLEWVRMHQPQAVVLVGQAGKRAHITPERVAINIDDARIPDNDGNQPVDQPIVGGAREAYFSTLPIRQMVAAMEAVGVPAQISNTAGTFVCNHVMYRLLHEADGMAKPFLTGFVHVPYETSQVERLHKMQAEKGQKVEEVPALSLAEIEKGLAAAIGAVVKALA